MQEGLLGGGWELGVQLVLVRWLKSGCLGSRGDWNRWASCCPYPGSTGKRERESNGELISSFHLCEFLMSHLVGC